VNCFSNLEEYYFKRGQECFDKRDYHWAVESFSKAIELSPGHEMAYFMRSEAYKKLGMAREAAWDCIKFLEIDNSSPGTTFDISSVVGIVKGVVDFASDLSKSARVSEMRVQAQQEIFSFGIPKLLEEIMEGYLPEGEYDDIRFYRLALGWVEKGYYRGFAHLLLKDFDEAIEEFDEAIIKDPANPNAHYFRGVTFLKKMEKDENREASSGYLERAYSDFGQALKNGFKCRICPGCGYRTDSALGYCMLCGRKLLVE
jgi:tetratricopeptide (TPR) repeat protein